MRTKGVEASRARDSKSGKRSIGGRLAPSRPTAHDPRVRTDLPAGTVTFLFTDVEGSTTLLHDLGPAAYAELLAEHRRVIRETCRAEAGVEVDTQGDGFFFAFPTAPGAAAAASAMVQGLAPGPIRVRVGLHTGAPLLTDEGYVGEDVHRAARIAAAGHGGQVLISSATASLLDVELLDLGEHRFKDLGAPERVYQLGDRAFPPLRSLYRTNLPVPSTPFLGREHEVAEIVDLVQRADVRLLTLTGPGGTGKTRAALQAAAEASDSFPGGLWWVALAPLRDAHLLPAALREALQIDEQPGQDLADSVAARLAGSKALVLLDNAEHLLPAIASEIARLRDVPGPTVLVTSRERLQLQGEHVYAVPSLAVEDGLALFLTRARALGTDVGATPEVVELCERLDYLPLALELAAARTLVFSPGQLLERLSEWLDLLRAGRDADPRQQTLRATIEWSYDLLDPEEQRVLRALSVFSGGCAFADAEAVCAADADTIQSLVDKSLLRRRASGVPRFFMLETIRELAGEKLAAAGEDDGLMRHHAEQYLEIALSANLASDREGQMHHDLVILERDNMRAALAWALDSGNWELGLELVVALENYWATNAAHEGREWAETLLASAPTDPSRARFRALRAQGGMENIIGQFELGEQHFGEALAMARTLGDELGIAILLHRLATAAAASGGDIERVRVLAEESLDAFRRIGFPKGEAQALTSLAEVAQAEGDTERALELLAESRRLAESSGFRWWQAGASARLAALLLSLGRLDDARADAEQALALSITMHDRSAIVYELGLLAEIHARKGQTERAGELWGAVDAEEARGPVGVSLHGPVRFRPSVSGPDAAFDGGLAAGGALTLDEAVAVALGEAPAT